MVKAAKTTKNIGMIDIIFNSLETDNILKKEGHLNYWVDRAYNIIENTHQIWLLIVCSILIGKAEYSA
jgi:hypothetical protein